MNPSTVLKLSGAEALVRSLNMFRVKDIFGLPGNQLRFYDALQRDGSIRHILVRHEQAAAHMADSYARATGRVGVCEASAGPGSSNLVTGIAEAYASSIPVVAITTTTRSTVSGRANFQELDLENLFRPIAKRVLSIDRAARIPEVVKRAFRIASSGTPGPVVIVLPADVHADEAVFHQHEFLIAGQEGQWPAHRISPVNGSVQHVVELLEQARRPLLWAGGGVLSSGAEHLLVKFAETMGIPVVTTYMGKGAIRETHPLAVGPVGQIGRPSTNEFVAKADLVIAIGTRFTNLDTANWTLPARDARIVHVNIDPEEIGRHFEVELGIWSDAKVFLQSLSDHCAVRQWREWSVAGEAETIASDWRRERGPESALANRIEPGAVHPLQAMRALQRCLRPDDVLVCDSGFNQIWGGQYYETQETGRRYIGPRGMGVMGFSLPAAIAGRIANPDRRYVALCGDGGFMMLLHELETSVREKAPVVVCVLNNRNLEYCSQIQQSIGGLPFSTSMMDTDFAQVALGLGCLGVRVDDAGALELALQEALTKPVTTVIDVVTPSSAMPDGVAL
ncbi:MAG: thiamine pyrophosphate-binding protein [Pusillimonas sp.]